VHICTDGELPFSAARNSHYCPPMTISATGNRMFESISPPAESRVRCVATALIGHTNFADRNQEIHFLKNMAMTGGFLYVAAFGGGAWSLDARWLRRGISRR
jgi:hypothetical protein